MIDKEKQRERDYGYLVTALQEAREYAMDLEKYELAVSLDEIIMDINEEFTK